VRLEFVIVPSLLKEAVVAILPDESNKKLE
jgi:hypothetical protein